MTMKTTTPSVRPALRVLIPALLLIASPVLAAEQALRPPAVPLVTIDPYTSVWSFNDRLHDNWPKHWTGKTQGMSGMVRVDGKAYRFMGGADVVNDAAEQVALTVRATSSEYQFNAGPGRLRGTFLSPSVMDELDVLSRPASYVTIEASASDGREHDVQAYVDV